MSQLKVKKFSFSLLTANNSAFSYSFRPIKYEAVLISPKETKHGNHQPIKTQEIGFYRVPKIIELLCISRSTWWLWVQNGKAPKGRKLSPGVTVWNRSDIHAFIDKINAEVIDTTTPPEAA